MSDLLKNVERAMYTFNMNNIIEICFEKTIKKDEFKDNFLSDTEKARIDNCIDKYLLGFNIVKEQTYSHVERYVGGKATTQENNL